MDRIKILTDFLRENPADSFSRHALALEYIKAGNDADARKLFEELLTSDPAYVGSYYHLAKLLERHGETEAAISWYEKGMDQAKLTGNEHAFRELRMAYEELL